MSNEEPSNEEPKKGWSTIVKGAAGALVVGAMSYAGALFAQVISAPRDTVAYDLVQAMTGGMLKPPAEKPAEPAPTRVASVDPAPPAQAPASPPPAAKPAPVAEAPAAVPTQPAVTAAPVPAPAGETSDRPQTLQDRLRQTAALVDKAGQSARALDPGRVLSFRDRSRASLCGSDFEVEVSSVAPQAGRVALKPAGGAGSAVTLSVGAPGRELKPGCSVALLLAMDDIDHRRAQLRETTAR